MAHTVRMDVSRTYLLDNFTQFGNTLVWYLSQSNRKTCSGQSRHLWENVYLIAMTCKSTWNQKILSTQSRKCVLLKYRTWSTTIMKYFILKINASTDTVITVYKTICIHRVDNHYQYTKPMRWNTEINFDLDSSIARSLLKTWLHVQPTDKFVPNRHFANGTDLFRFFL